jgi:hypothetical protein
MTMEHRIRKLLFISLTLYERSEETLGGNARDALELDKHLGCAREC